MTEREIIQERAARTFDHLLTTGTAYSAESFDALIQHDILEPLAMIGETLTAKQLVSLQKANIDLQIRSALDDLHIHETTDDRGTEGSEYRARLRQGGIPVRLERVRTKLSLLDRSGNTGKTQIQEWREQIKRLEQALEQRLEPALDRICKGIPRDLPAAGTDEEILERARRMYEHLLATNIPYTSESFDDIISRAIIEPLEAINQPLTKADRSGETTERSEILDNLREANEILQLRCAEDELYRFETTDDDYSEERIAHTRERIEARVGGDLPILDFYRSDDTQMRLRFERAANRIRLWTALHDLYHLETATVPLTEEQVTAVEGRIRGRLAAGGIALSELDLSGASDNAQIEQRFHRIHVLNRARILFAQIEGTTNGEAIEERSAAVITLLTEISAPISALDATGRRTDPQMRGRFHRAVTRGQLLRTFSDVSSMNTSRRRSRRLKAARAIVHVADSAAYQGVNLGQDFDLEARNSRTEIASYQRKSDAGRSGWRRFRHGLHQ